MFDIFDFDLDGKTSLEEEVFGMMLLMNVLEEEEQKSAVSFDDDFDDDDFDDSDF